MSNTFSTSFAGSRRDLPGAMTALLSSSSQLGGILSPLRQQYLFPVSKLKPVVMDESLTGFDALLRGRQIGYTGVALKACKGQSQSMVLNAAAQEFKMYMTAQDLTCPGASLIQSAGIAAHVAKIDTLESNGREYVPSANQPWLKRFPGLFQVRDGKLHTANLTGPGLSAV